MSSITPPRPVSPTLNPSQIKRSISRLRECIKDLENFDVTQVTSSHNTTAVSQLEKKILHVLASTFGDRTTLYGRFNSAGSLDNAPISMGVFSESPSASRAQHYIRKGIQEAIPTLNMAIQELQDRLDDMEVDSPSPDSAESVSPNEVFIVHGHDHAARDAVARWINHLGLKATILNEQPDHGNTIIEKFIHHAASVAFAVVLMTPDDVGATTSNSDNLQQRARQNVLYELGYFTAKLGRGKVCLMHKGNVEIPSDLYGVIYTSLDGDSWKLKLSKELKAAGLLFDAERAFM